MRQRGMSLEDQRFRVALTNLRYKACTAEDRALLRSRIATSNGQPILPLPSLTGISVITARNSHRDAINELGTEVFSRQYGRQLVAFHSIDQWCSERTGNRSVRQTQREYIDSSNPVRGDNTIAPDIQQVLWRLPPCLTDHHAGILRLCRGMPVLLKTNESTELCATNGAEAIVYDWHSVRSNSGVEVLETLFVQLVNPPKPVKLDGLPDNVIPLNRTKVRIKCMLPMLEKPVYIEREQVMVLPNFAMTDFASQGRTRSVNVCHLKYCRSAQSLYTCLSRSSSLSSTFILDGFDESKTIGGLSSALKREFCELELLDDITKMAHAGTLPAFVPLEYRSETIRAFLEWKGHGYVPPFVHPALNWSQEGYKVDVDILPRQLFNAGLSDCHASTSRSDQSRTSKRKRRQTNDASSEIAGDHSQPNRPAKKRRTRDTICRQASQVRVGFIWDSTNYSCAYDALFTVILNACRDGLPIMSEDYTWMNDGYHMLMRTLSVNSSSDTTLEVRRDSIRDYLTNIAPNIFPRYGPALAAVSDVVEYIFRPLRPFGQVLLQCSACNVTTREVRSLSTPLWIITGNLNGFRHLASRSSAVEDYMLTLLTSDQSCQSNWCSRCRNPLKRTIELSHALPFLFIELQPNVMSHLETRRHITFSVRGIQRTWRLCGAIYLGMNHFTCRYIDSHGMSWYHDGMFNGRFCAQEADVVSIDLMIAHDRQVSHLVYALTSNQ
ncbi:hypothetical protein C8Q70DRAFT_909909 [Cubamyces menziesii]|nr:hypothetical protein C8Q70DRAFT_909909 [Cubamyces menziesii]